MDEFMALISLRIISSNAPVASSYTATGLKEWQSISTAGGER